MPQRNALVCDIYALVYIRKKDDDEEDDDEEEAEQQQQQTNKKREKRTHKKQNNKKQSPMHDPTLLTVALQQYDIVHNTSTISDHREWVSKVG